MRIETDAESHLAGAGTPCSGSGRTQERDPQQPHVPAQTTRIVFLLPDGTEMVVNHTGLAERLMDLGRKHGVPGIGGDCGGGMACASCHVHVAPEWMAAVGSPSTDEQEMIQFAANPGPESRLACQIWIGGELDGLRIKVQPT